MGDHKEVFRSLQELFPQVDHRILKAISIEHRKDVDSAVVAVLDEVMPSMTGSAGPLSAHHEVLPSMVNYVGISFSNHSTHEVGSSLSAESEHHIHEDEVDGSVHSMEVKTGTQENIDNEYVGRHTSIQGISEQLNLPFDPILNSNEHTSIQGISEQLNLPSDPVLNGNEHDFIPNLDVASSNTSPERKLADSDNKVGYNGLSSASSYQPPIREDGGDNIIDKAPQSHDQDYNISPVGGCSSHSNLLKLSSGYDDINFDADFFLSPKLPPASNDQISSGMLRTKKYSFAPVLDDPCPDKEESSASASRVIEQKDASNVGTGCNKQPEGDIVENGDILLSRTDMLPDLNLNHFASTASTHSSHSVSIESLEDSIVDARSNKNDLLPSLELVTKMLEDVELLEEKAKVDKHESSAAGTVILTKVEELKEMLTHAKEANDMHAGEVFGEKAILTTEVRELQSRLQRLSDERNKYLTIIEEIHQSLAERLIAAKQEIEAAEKEKIEKEAAAHLLLDEQEQVMNSVVEESRKLQKEAEENLKLKEFLVERGHIVDTLQGEMAVICEDVLLLKKVVDERLSLSKLQRSSMSSLSSSVHSSLHKSWSSSVRTAEAVESPEKHPLAEAADPVANELDGMESSVEVSDGNDTTGKGICKRADSNEDGDGWELC